MNRFVAIIESPGHLWSEHAVVDLVRQVRICRCSDAHDAQTIAACLNIQFQEREAKQLEDAK